MLRGKPSDLQAQCNRGVIIYGTGRTQLALYLHWPCRQKGWRDGIHWISRGWTSRAKARVTSIVMILCTTSSCAVRVNGRVWNDIKHTIYSYMNIGYKHMYISVTSPVISYSSMCVQLQFLPILRATFFYVLKDPVTPGFNIWDVVSRVIKYLPSLHLSQYILWLSALQKDYDDCTVATRTSLDLSEV